MQIRLTLLHQLPLLLLQGLSRCHPVTGQPALSH
jgi:hypothetical protein